MLKTGKSLRNPIYMAFRDYPIIQENSLPIIRHSLSNYKNDFLANEKSKTQSFYELAKSNLNTEVIEYLIEYHRRNRSYYHSKTKIMQNFAIVIDENPEVLKLLRFYLEYVAANYQYEFSNYYDGYNFLYRFFNLLPTLDQKYGWSPPRQAMEIMDLWKKFLAPELSKF